MTIINEERKYGELKKKALEWWIVKDVMLKKLTWLKKTKKKALMKLLKAIKLLVTFKTVNTKWSRIV